MFERLLDGKDTNYDIAFYRHELLEAKLCAAGKAAVNVNDAEAVVDFLKQIHGETLTIQQNSERDLYHPDVVNRYPTYFRRER